MDRHGYMIRRMKTADVLAFFGSQNAVASRLGIRQPSVASWGEYPPDNRQLQIQKLTRGRLKAEPGCLDRVLGMDKVKGKVA